MTSKFLLMKLDFPVQSLCWCWGVIVFNCGHDGTINIGFYWVLIGSGIPLVAADGNCD